MLSLNGASAPVSASFPPCATRQARTLCPVPSARSLDFAAANARTAFVDARDIGRVAARVFTECGHVGKAYTLSGAQSLTYYQVAGAPLLGRDAPGW